MFHFLQGSIPFQKLIFLFSMYRIFHSDNLIVSYKQTLKYVTLITL